MGEIRLFHVIYDGVHRLEERSFSQEHELHKLFETHLHDLTGITFLASEYVTSSGRIDTLGIDDRDCPVVIEYKRGLDENVINQGVRYLNWLKRRDNHENFRRLVREKIAPERVKGINFKGAWLLCVAGAFPAQDIDAAGNSKARVELVRYRRFGHDLNMLMLEWVYPHRPVSPPIPPPPDPPPGPEPDTEPMADNGNPFSINDDWRRCTREMKALFQQLHDFAKALGDDVQLDAFRTQFSFKRVSATRKPVFAYLHLPVMRKAVKLSIVATPPGEKRKFDNALVRNQEELEKVKSLLRNAYEVVRKQ